MGEGSERNIERATKIFSWLCANRTGGLGGKWGGAVKPLKFPSVASRLRLAQLVRRDISR